MPVVDAPDLEWKERIGAAERVARAEEGDAPGAATPRRRVQGLANMDALQQTSEMLEAHKAARAARRARRPRIRPRRCATSATSCAPSRRTGAVDAHKSFLDKVRRRDENPRRRGRRTRAYADKRAKADRGRRCAGLNAASTSCSWMQDIKRLRAAAHAVDVERAKEEQERELLRTQLAQTRDERERLRAHTASLETRLAVLEASHKLDTCRKSLV